MQRRKIYREIFASYDDEGCGCDDCQNLRLESFTAIYLEPYNKVIDQIAQDLQSGKLKPSDLSEDLIKQIYADLSTGTQKTYQNDWVKYDIKEPNSLIQKFKKNLWQFSSAKTLVELEHINSLMLDKNGKIRTHHEFTQEVRKANIKFNRNYLQAEWQTARRGAQMAEMWRGFMKNADLFPNLQYRTVGDSRVRDEHASLNGIVKSVGDSFWGKYYPPNGWRCRCSVVQTAEKASTENPEKPNVLPEFQGNVALDAEIFTSKGNFFKLLNLDHKAKTNAELMKLNAPYDLAYKTKNGKKVLASIFADEADKVKNIETAMVVVDKLNKDVFIRPHIEVENHKNPEYLIEGKLADRKEQSGKNIASNLKSARAQGCRIVVFDISKEYPYTLEKFKNNLRGFVKEYYEKDFDKIIIVVGNKAEEIEVADLLK